MVAQCQATLPIRNRPMEADLGRLKNIHLRPTHGFLVAGVPAGRPAQPGRAGARDSIRVDTTGTLVLHHDVARPLVRLLRRHLCRGAPPPQVPKAGPAPRRFDWTARLRQGHPGTAPGLCPSCLSCGCAHSPRPLACAALLILARTADSRIPFSSHHRRPRSRMISASATSPRATWFVSARSRLYHAALPSPGSAAFNRMLFRL
jgi:hypothetical protein